MKMLWKCLGEKISFSIAIISRKPENLRTDKYYIINSIFMFDVLLMLVFKINDNQCLQFTVYSYIVVH